MTDLSHTIIPKSDQLNADDLIAGPRTITVTNIKAGSGDQPTSIFFDGDNGKPFKPCKSMRRLLIICWGKDGSQYVGRSMTLFNDTNVKWAGQAVGGIRISHLSHVDGRKTVLLTVSRGQRKEYTVQPLQAQSGAADALIAEGDAAAERGSDALEAFWTRLTPAERKTLGASRLEAWKAITQQNSQPESPTCTAGQAGGDDPHTPPAPDADTFPGDL